MWAKASGALVSATAWILLPESVLAHPNGWVTAATARAAMIGVVRVLMSFCSSLIKSNLNERASREGNIRPHHPPHQIAKTESETD